jgi:deazaflavin-dependent oxidoreductase (nitroreductase family)
MTEQTQRPYDKPGTQRLMRLINVPMRMALRLPFPTPLNKQLMLLAFTGRKSGRAYKQPVSYIPDDGTLLTPGGGKWKLNLREDTSITVWLRGHKVMARPEFVRDADEVERLLKKMAAANPRVASFVPVIESDGEVDQDKLENAIHHGFCVIRWHLEGADSRQLSQAMQRS